MSLFFPLPKSFVSRWPRYTPVDPEERVSEASKEQDIGLCEPLQTRQGHVLTHLHVLNVLVLAVFLAAGFGLGALSALQYTSSSNQIQRPSSSGPIPDFPLVSKPVERNPGFREPASPESNALWRSAIPYGLFVHVPDGQERFGLAPGMPTDGPNPPYNGSFDAYGLTWTHEYHCLKMIREDFWDLVYGDSPMYHARGHKETLPLEVRIRLGHNAHCMEYIRQMIVCHADMTLEPRAPYPASNGLPYHIDGYGTSHTCKDSDEIIRFMEKHAPEAYVNLG